MRSFFRAIGQAIGLIAPTVPEPSPTLAQIRIAENKRTKDKYLYLGGCGLTAVPEEVKDLIWLEGLSLADGWDRPPEDEKPGKFFDSMTPYLLSNGDTSDYDENWWWRFSRVRNNKSNKELRNIDSLAGLLELRSLVISDTKVSDISVLAGLVKFQALYAANTQIADITPLANLANLTLLEFDSTPIHFLPQFNNLASLRYLNISNTKITDLAPLAPLLPGKLSVGISMDGTMGCSDLNLWIVNCPLVHPPPQIVSNGRNEILNYFVELQNPKYTPVQKRITINKMTKNKFLSFSGCDLTTVPAEVGELVWLEGLSLTNYWAIPEFVDQYLPPFPYDIEPFFYTPPPIVPLPPSPVSAPFAAASEFDPLQSAAHYSRFPHQQQPTTSTQFGHLGMEMVRQGKNGRVMPLHMKQQKKQQPPLFKV